MAAKIRAQAYPAATTLTALYTVGANILAFLRVLTISNHAAADCTVRVSIAPLGAADANAQYLRYDMLVPANDGIDIPLFGTELIATDVVRVYSSNATTSFGLYGGEADV